MSSPSHKEEWATPRMGWPLPGIQRCLKPGGRSLRARQCKSLRRPLCQACQTLIEGGLVQHAAKHPCQACQTLLRESAVRMQAGHMCRTCQTLLKSMPAQLLCGCKHNLRWHTSSGPCGREPQAWLCCAHHAGGRQFITLTVRSLSTSKLGLFKSRCTIGGLQLCR